MKGEGELRSDEEEEGIRKGRKEKLKLNKVE